MSAQFFRQYGWQYFTIDLTQTTNPTWPTRASGTPEGWGGSTVSATPPSGLITPIKTIVVLRGIFPTNLIAASIKLRQGDGSTPYFDDSTFQQSSATNPLMGIGQANVAFPLHNGLCAISTSSVAGRLIIAYEVVN